MCFFCLSMSGLKDDAVFRALTHQLEERIPRANKQDVTNIMLKKNLAKIWREIRKFGENLARNLARNSILGFRGEGN